ncbi:MAG TPA: PAS domain-containing protein, partial [Patescibacteria group bacterium]|nr:PAS domain-containing protein [Patescibacteria group bacterium]
MATRNKKGSREIKYWTTSGPDSTFGDEKYSQLRMALEAADIGLWDWELDSNRIVMSANMKRLLDIGNGGEDDSFETFLQVIHPDDKAHIAAALNKAIKQKGAFDEEFRTEKKDR